MKKITSVLFLFYCFSVGWAQTVPPCTLEITDAETFARDWTVIDVNSDVSANTWAYNDGNAMYTQDKSNAADDWLIAPAVTLEAGKAYKVSAYVKHSSTFGSDKQKIELKIGTAPTVEGLTTRLVYDESFQSRLFVEKSGTFSPAESGVFYVGLRCYSESYNGDLYFQKIVIEEAPVYPAQITDLSIVAGERGAMSATLSWTWPSSDHLGGALSNLLGAKIYRRTDLVATLDTATVGGKAGWIDSSIETAGNYTYKVVAYNTFGDSQGSATTVTSPWIGNDTPAAVTDLVASAEDATVSLSFTPPTVGKNGGYIDTEALTYEIGRTPGGVLSESFSGPFPYIDEVPELGSYVYTVVAMFDGKASVSVASNKVVAGGAKELPYSESFDTESSLDLFTILSANGDNSTWKYESSKKMVQYWGGSDADEWLITPKLNLVAGKNYKLLFKTGLENAASEESYKDLSVTIGRAATVEAQSTRLFRDTIQSALMEEKEAVFSVSESGGYHIGFHCYGQTNWYAIFIDDLSVDETVVVPAVVSDLTVAPGEQGAMSATVAWTNPSLSAAGTQLPMLTKMELYRGETLIYTQEDPIKGGSEQVIDEDVPAPGKYEYRVIGYVEENAGEAAVVESAWIGADTPKSVTDVELTDAEGKPQVTFRAPAEGVNGGYIDVENLRYRIVRDPGSEMLTESLTNTVYVDSDDLSLALYRYTVTTLSGDMESESVTSNALVFGRALGLPYETSMDSTDEIALWTIVDANNDTKSWVYDATEKEMKYTAYSAADDWLFTPPFEAKKGSHTLEFRARAEKYRYPESIEVTLGSDVLPGESQTVIASYPEINSTLSELYTVDFSVPSDGVWYIGLHATTRDPWGLYISSCSIISNVISGIDGLECMNEVYFDRSNHSLVFDKGGDIQIINAAGVTVVSCESESGRMDLSQLPAGLYIAHVVTEEGKTIQIKFIK